MPPVVVAGALASKWRNGGEAWVRLSWLRAFQQIGFDVYFVEQIPEAGLVDAFGAPAAWDEAANPDYFAGVMAEFGLENRSSLLYAPGNRWAGIPPKELEAVTAEAELLVNISGNLTLQPLLNRFRRRVYVDIDPGFTQYWHVQGRLGRTLEDHDFHFTIGENIGKPACPIPDGGIRWLPTRQPVVLDDWPPSPSPACHRLTTVGSLRGPYGRIQHDGRLFGLKIHEMRRFVPLAARVNPTLEMALSIGAGDERDRSLLADSGWRLVDPGAVVGGPQEFRDYVRGSDGEFSVAQGIYVETESGWFSDRTARYLASSKPAVVQDTGFASNLPVGEGLVTFRTLSEAAGAVQAVWSDYERHCRRARQIAEEFFESGKVVINLLEQVGVAP
jgi:hypothetical protein